MEKKISDETIEHETQGFINSKELLASFSHDETIKPLDDVYF